MKTKNQIKEANRYSYSVRINDISIFFDGLLPKYILNPFEFEKGVQIKFGIENLGFSGNDNGYEKIVIPPHKSIIIDNKISWKSKYNLAVVNPD